VKLRPAIVIEPVRSGVPPPPGESRLLLTVNLTVPLPVPDARPSMVIQLAFGAAVQEHPSPVVTVTVTDPEPPPDPKVSLTGEIEYVHGAAA
jgi:hypothetical protein